MKRFMTLFLIAVLSFSALYAETLTPEISEEEKALPYSKYYEQGVVTPSDDILSQLECPLSDEEAIYPEDIESAFNLDDEFISGYALLDNGVAYAGVETVYEGVTPELFGAYQGWKNSLPDQVLAYKLWYPGMHIEEKDIGTCRWMCENMGSGFIHLIAIGTGDLEDKGIDSSLTEDERILMTAGMNSMVLPVESSYEDRPYPSNILHIFYVTDEGFVADRCIIYFGCMYDDGNVLVDLNGNEFTQDTAKGIAEHIAYENANAAHLALQLRDEGVI